MRRLLVNALAIGATFFTVYVAYAAVRIQWQSERDEARAADVIIVLGAAEYHGRPSPVLKARLDHALQLWKRGLAPRILTTGGAGGDPIFTEGGVGRSYLIAKGVPAERITVELEGESTVYSTLAAAEMMRSMGLKSCIVVSDGYHIFRVKKILQQYGFEVYGSPRPQVLKGDLNERWQHVRQAAGYVLWAIGIPL